MNTNKKTLSLYWQQIRNHKISLILAMVFVPLSEISFTLMIPLFFSQAIGGLTVLDKDVVYGALIAAAIAAGFGVLFNTIGFQALTRQAADVGLAIRNDTFRRLINKDMSFFVNQKVGALTSKYIDFVRAEDALLNLLVIRTLGFSITLIVGIFIVATQSIVLAISIAILCLFLIAEVRWSMQKREHYRREKNLVRAELHGTVADAFTNNLIVKTFARENTEIKTVNRISKKLRILLIRDISFLSYEGSVRNLVMYAAQVIIISICAYNVLNGSLALATLVFIMAYLQRISSQLFVLGEIINGYDLMLLEAAPMSDIITQQIKVVDSPNAKKLVVNNPVVSLENVSYQYETDTENVLKNVDLHISAGEKIGIVGHSGAGKTTLVHLLLRFNDVTDGRITIDGHDIRDITQASLREAISFVPQEPMLFHRSLLENIRYGKIGATDVQIQNAVIQANADRFVSTLPHGLDTLVGERGVKLSGGQKQRIAIARALLKDAPIIVLDEATSALDSQSEKLIQEALWELMKNRTAIVIAHRLSTIQKMDRIIVLNDGVIAEQGTHHDLLKISNGIYATLWNHQSGGFIKD